MSMFKGSKVTHRVLSWDDEEMCNYPNLIMIVYKHKISGQLVYSFDHWTTKDGQRAVVYDVPSHQTQVLHYFDEDELEFVERKEWSL